jgi:hypothetical protein
VPDGPDNDLLELLGATPERLRRAAQEEKRLSRMHQRRAKDLMHQRAQAIAVLEQNGISVVTDHPPREKD